MSATEFVPNQAQTEAITAHVLWMTVALVLDTVAELQSARAAR